MVFFSRANNSRAQHCSLKPSPCLFFGERPGVGEGGGGGVEVMEPGYFGHEALWEPVFYQQMSGVCVCGLLPIDSTSYLPEISVIIHLFFADWINPLRNETCVKTTNITFYFSLCTCKFSLLDLTHLLQ